MPIDYRPPEAIPLKPQAAPVDTFTGAPQPVQDTRLQELAAGLSKLDSGLRDFMDARQAKQDQEDVLRGQQAFYENNQVGFEDAVREGKIPAFASPTFVASYKKAQGNVAGFDLQARFSAAYDKWDGKTSNDPNAFSDFAKGFMKEHLGKNQDPQVLKGLLPHVNSLMTSGLEQWVKDRHKATYEGAIITGAAEVSATVEGAGKTALQSGKPTDYKALFGDIMGIRERAIKSGVKPLDMDKSLVDMVTAKAIEDRDPALLKFLDEKVPGTDMTFAQTPHGQKQKQEAIDKLETLGRRSIADAHTEQARQDEKAKKAVTSGIIEYIAKNPGKAVPEDLLVLGSKYDPDIRVNVVNWAKALREPTASDPQQILQLHRDIISGRGPQAIREALDRGIIRNPQDLDKAFSLSKSVDEAGDRVQAILKMDASKRIMDAIKARTANESNMALVMGNVIGLPDDGLAATSDFERMLLDFVRSNPDASVEQQRAYIDKAGKIILDSLSSKEIGREAKYSRPSELSTEQPLGGGAAKAPEVPPMSQPPQPGQPTAGPQATQPAAPVEERKSGLAPMRAPPPPPPVPQVDPLAAKTWFNVELSGSQRIAVERDAQDKGVPLEQHLLGLYQKFLQGEKGGTSTAPMTAEDAGGGGDDAPVGLVEPGNIDLNARPKVPTVDEQGRPSIATVRSMSFSEGGPEIVIPTVAADGSRVLSEAEAIAQYRATGQHLGKFDTPENATAFGKKLSGEQAKQYVTPTALSKADTIERIAASANPDNVKLRAELDVLTAIQRAKASPTRLVREGALFATARLRNDPVAANLLDLAAGPESGGNYNAVLGNARSTADLSQMTIGEVFSLQRRMVARGMKSGAVGRYQFINSTLRGLVDEMELSESTKFTPELQDRLGLALLERRGYSEWRAGRLSDEAFAKNLSQEWAGLPDPATGRSFYKGQQAGISRESMMAALRGFGGAILNTLRRRENR